MEAIRYTLSGWIKIFTFYDEHQEIRRCDMIIALKTTGYAWSYALTRALSNDFRFKNRTRLNPRLDNVDLKGLVKSLTKDMYKVPVTEEAGIEFNPEDISLK